MLVIWTKHLIHTITSSGTCVVKTYSSLELLSCFRWFGLMPAYSKTDDTLATKLVAVYPNNHDKGIPSHLAHVLLYEAETGALKAVRT